MSIRQCTPTEAHLLLQQGYRYVDVRTESEFANGHPDTAVNIPVAVPDPSSGQMLLNSEFVVVVRKHFQSGQALVLGCQAGGRSQHAAVLLEKAGFTDLVNVVGGFGGGLDPSGRPVPGWVQSGLPVCRTCTPGASYRELRGGA